jgi:hypothetical protein
MCGPEESLVENAFHNPVLRSDGSFQAVKLPGRTHFPGFKVAELERGTPIECTHFPNVLFAAMHFNGHDVPLQHIYPYI